VTNNSLTVLFATYSHTMTMPVPWCFNT